MKRQTFKVLFSVIFIAFLAFAIGCGGGGGGNPVAPPVTDSVRVNAVSDSDLDHFASEFETHIHNLMLNSYGPVYDIDNDGKVSILISPVYSKLGFAGLFNSNDFDSNENSNQRDLIGIFSPDTAKSWYGERWREASRETICHEMQHLVNYSANLYFNNVGAMEDVWLDESLSVGAEARYRLLRGSPILENRFTLWAESPSSVGLTNFSRSLSQYGMVGLFNLFLYHQSNDVTIKAMVNSNLLGKANVDNLFATKGGLDGMLQKWAMAAFLDGLNKKGLADLSKIDSGYKYSSILGLDLQYQSVNFGQSTTNLSIPAYGAAFYLLNQPVGFNSNSYQFKVDINSVGSDSKKLEVLMVRLPSVSGWTKRSLRSAVVGGTSVLATPGTFYSYSHPYSSTTSEFSLNIPTDSSIARFALVVTNPTSTSQTVKIIPESYDLGQVAANIKPSSQYVDDYGQLLLNQAQLKARLRMMANKRISNSMLMASKTMRASDHSSENVGDIVNLKVVADWWGASYVSRRCKLERITPNCKIFVDQEPYNGLSAVPVEE
ncbi:MAG: cell wall-associated protease [Clostridiales bacterium]|nr:cell wall-associated protease [Clostridiales bacterium]MDN5282565.1 cell wall-associated protease [Candidatus Ozemobacter sp.]